MSVKTAPPRRRYHHGDLRRALLESALELIARSGAAALTLRAVARLAGVSPAAPYRHFADKEALLAAVAEEGYRELAAAMLEAAAGVSGEAQRLAALGQAYVGYARAHPARFRVMFGPAIARKERHPALAAAAADAYRLLVDAVAAGQRAAVLRPASSTEDLALAAWATVHGLSSLLVDGQIGAATGERELEATLRGVLDTLFTGLEAGLRDAGETSRQRRAPPARRPRRGRPRSG